MLSLMLFLSLGTNTYASSNLHSFDSRMNDPKWYQLSQPSVREITLAKVQSSSVSKCASTHTVLPSDIDLSDIVNYGKIAWDIIIKGQPVLDFTGLEANALPKGESTWQGLECWEAPQARAYQIIYKNGFGMEVVKFNYKVVYSFGGRVNGMGRYLAHVSVIPDVKVLWGFSLNANVTAETPLNSGSSVDPVGQIQLDVEYTLVPFIPLSKVQEKQSFVMRGDGFFQKL